MFAFTVSIISETGKGDPDENDRDQRGIRPAEHGSGRHPRSSAAAAECEGCVGFPFVCSHPLQKVRETKAHYCKAVAERSVSSLTSSSTVFLGQALSLSLPPFLHPSLLLFSFSLLEQKKQAGTILHLGHLQYYALCTITACFAYCCHCLRRQR